MDEHKYLPTTRITQPAHSDHRCKLRFFKILLTVLGFRRPTAAKTLSGSSGDDQSSRTMKLFPELGLCICESMNKISLLVIFWYQEFARSDWMGLSGGD